MIKILVTVLFFIMVFTTVSAQDEVDRLLDSIAVNNKTLKALDQVFESKKLEYSTGIFLENPSVEYDLLTGNPSESGNMTELTIKQSFDFPTVYMNRKKLIRSKISGIEYERKALEQDILIEAKLTCIELIYHNKYKNELEKRYDNARRLLDAYNMMLEKGTGNMLEVNKIKLQHLNAKNETLENDYEIVRLSDHLTEMNGGSQVVFNDTAYPLLPDIPDFETLEQTYEEYDPDLKIIYQNKKIFERQVVVNRALTFPKFEAGYRSESAGNNKFSGIHLGMTIPLWENKNTVKRSKADVISCDLMIEEHLSEHYFEIKHLYDRYESLKTMQKEYSDILKSANNITLLDKSLQFGRISLIEYIMEISFINETVDKYLLSEMQYYQCIAKLYKYEL